MNKTLPNKYIRKAIIDALNGLEVNGYSIPVYDTRVPSMDTPNHYIIISTQVNNVLKQNICEDFWESNTTLDIVTSYSKPGNPGSRLLCNDITDEVLFLLDDFTMPVESDLKVLFQTISTPNELYLETESENIYRCLMQISLELS
jgi:hypothetical protein